MFRLTTVLLGTLFPAQLAIGQDKEQTGVEDVPSIERKAEKDDDKTYFLIGHDGERKAPKKGYKLMLILPGGDGSREFETFCKRIYKYALDEDYVAAQLVSKKWTDDQQIIWPTDKNEVKKMKFSTEEFIDAVIEDVESQVEIDRSHIFTLTWSSSGPAAYAAALKKKSRITGSFIAMSVFKPNYLPKLKNGKGRAFYIYHSDDDKICPMRMARDAEAKLGKAKAKVEFATYDGGHGWRGPVWPNMKKGVTWLEKNHSKAVKAKKPKRDKTQGKKSAKKKK